MSLIVHVQSARGFHSKGERFAKITFRGVSQSTQIFENVADEVVWDEQFEWAMGSSIEPNEMLEINVMSFNKYLTNKVIGSFKMVLQQVMEKGSLKIGEPLLDSNNRGLNVAIFFEVFYQAPDGTVGDWKQETFTAPPPSHHASDNMGFMDQEMDYDEDGSRSLYSENFQMVKKGHYGSSQSLASTKSSKSLLGKMKRKKKKKKDDYVANLGIESIGKEATLLEIDEMDGSMMGDESDVEEEYEIPPYKKIGPIGSELPAQKFQDFQVSITIHEARQLAGLDIDPVICVEVGDKKKYTSEKKSTNCPFYNEMFAFDYHEPPGIMFDKIIKITALHSRNVLRSGTVIGYFKFDVGTLYQAQDHAFNKKWAILTDPNDINGGPKGYVKCDILIMGKGDSVKPPKKTKDDGETIEGNYLLPEGIPTVRPRATFSVRVYRAEGLPIMNSGLLANVKKAITGEMNDLVDPFVEVTFAGQTGKTSVKKHRYDPAWNEQIVFSEMFPPLCRRMKIVLKDKDSVIDDTIGTTFIDLAKISSENDEGFLPTFGPSWINLYGSTRDYSAVDSNRKLNRGVGEGCMYRGRLLIAIKTEVQDSSMESGGVRVDTESCLPISEAAPGRKDEFFFFASLFEASMIDKKLGDKPITFEFSVGNHGNQIDGRNRHQARTTYDESDSEEEQLIQSSSAEPEPEVGVSMTPPMQPKMVDKNYYYMPFNDKKPIMYLKFTTEDHRRRFYNMNILYKIAETLEEGIADVTDRISKEKPNTEKVLRKVLKGFVEACTQFSKLTKGTGGGANAGKTKLDRERHKWLLNEMEEMNKKAKDLLKGRQWTPRAIKEKLKATRGFLHRLKFLADEPQHSLPDLFVWMISNGKRVAYTKISARKLMYSMVEEEKGPLCGTMQTLFLKLPGKKGTGSGGWTVQAKVDVFLWLGLNKHRKDMLKGLPSGYHMDPELKAAVKPTKLPPPLIFYREKLVFQLRCHIYQARSLIGSDSSGLSDPFARVVLRDEVKQTRVIQETLSPTWDEVLIFERFVVYGNRPNIKDEPPIICIEFFDIDIGTGCEFIGRTLIRPVVNMLDDLYEKPLFPPMLQWHDIYRGQSQGGQLLATVEMIQLTKSSESLPDGIPIITIPPYDEKKKETPIVNIPKEIKPRLCRFRVEILFWGVRELKRLQLMTVDKPRCDIEVGGITISSSIISNAQRNPNFPNNVQFIDVDLPENDLYCPPLTIRVVDCRQFGRFTLVGTNVVGNLSSYKLKEKEEEKPEEPQFLSGLKSVNPFSKDASAKVPELLGAAGAGGGPPGPERGGLNGSARLPGNGYAQSLNGNGNLLGSGRASKAGSKAASKAGSKAGSVIITVDPPLDPNGKGQPPAGDAVIDMLQDGKPPLEGEGGKEDTGKEGSVKGSEGMPGESKEGEAKEGEHNEAAAAAAAKKKLDEDEENSLDWWSKYFATRAAIEKEQGDQADGNLDLDLEQPENEELIVIDTGDKKENKDKEEGKKKGGALKKMGGGLAAAKKLMKKGDGDEDSQLEVNMEAELDVCHIQFYSTELENVPDFNGFKEWLHTFELLRGKNTGDEDSESRVVGKFKGALALYKWPLPPEIEKDPTKMFGTLDPKLGYFQKLPKNDPMGVLVRVYIIKAIDLHPTDVNGKADPYVQILLGKNKNNDKENYISKNLNPTFGKCFEFEATFPMESKLAVQIYDWDLIGSDDLIGETLIDLENRYYSKHRATCGISKEFNLYGYNNWRDPQKPSQILTRLCKESKLELRFSPGRAEVGDRIFHGEQFIEDEGGNSKQTDDLTSLEALLHWDEIAEVGCKLVPEHVETRSLYHPDKPGIEQGKVEMWVDMFPMDMPLPSAPVDISPRKPKRYELRVVIWNTDDVVLEDDSLLTGEKMSDIYVKGWLLGPSTDNQSTDVHYRSLTGEGNFNWRFIFQFDYLAAEEKMVIKKKESAFSIDETEYKVPPRLTLQVWDADHFSADDFLGSVSLDLNRFPRGAKSAKKCSIESFRAMNMMSIFKLKRTKGWWPFIAKSEKEGEELTGKVEAEMALLTEEEAEKSPAGKAREEPDPLPKPNRPDTSFIWFMSPFRALKFMICNRLKWLCIKLLVVCLLLLLIGLFIYASPGYIVKKILGA